MKKSSLNIFGSLVVIFSLIVSVTSCVHQPIPPTGNGNGNGNDNGTDTTGSGTDTTGTGTDTTVITDQCDPDTVYFENDILPLLNSSCGITGCHDPATAEEGVVLTNYNSIMNTGDVRPGRPGNSEIYEKMTDNDPSDKMPPPGSGITLSQDQINMVYTWINQGAQNNSCDPNAGGCETQNMSYQNDINPIINNNCVGCHNSTLAQGNIRLDNYNGVAAAVNSGRLEGAITWAAGYTPMPYNQSKLDQCSIDKIKSWVNDGAPNN